MKTILRCAHAAAFALFATLASAQSFGPELRLVTNSGPSIQPTVAAVGNNVYAVWVENFDQGGGNYTGDIYFARSTNGGTSFSPAVPLTSTPSRNDILPIIAAAGTQVHVFWTDSAASGDVFHRRSNDSGANFAAEVQLTPTDGYYSRPTGAIVDASGNVHLSFYDNRPPAGNYGQVFYQCSGDSGANFTSATNITAFDGVVDNEAPRFAQGTDGTLYLLFRSTRVGLPQGGWPPFEQFVMRTSAPVTTCGGMSWLKPPQRVSVGPPDDIANAYGANFVAGAGNALHVAYWLDKNGTNLVYRRGVPNGAGWQAPVEISGHGTNHLEWDGTAADHTLFGIAEDAAGKLHVVFGENNHLREGFASGPLYYRCSNDGATWAARKAASAQTETAQPRGAYGNNRFHMVWMDWRDNNFGAEIYYRNAAAGTCGGGVLTDLNADGRSDLLYRNFTTGQIYRMTMNGFSVTGAALAYTEGNTAWRVIADADFNGDGTSDLLWRNTSTGQFFMQPFNTSGMPGGGTLFYTEANAAWKVIQTPDLDGDGKADLLWWNSSTGQVYAMLMNGASIVAQGLVYTEPNTAWRIEAAGDFAGSGKKNQLVYRNTSTGQVFLLTVNHLGGGAFSASGLLIYNSSPPYQIIAAQDFNGDGRTDLLWRNPSTGQVYMLLMNGATVIAEGFVFNEPNLAWKIVSAGDYNGDGKADILYRNDSTGQVYMILMNGMGISNQALVYTEANTAWRLLGPYEYALFGG